jgi:hypothetical protein
MMTDPNETLEERPRKRRKRTITVTEVIEFLEYLSPPSLSDPEEPYGLQVGAPGEEVRTIVVAPMASFVALSTAAVHKRPLLLTAAPLLTRPLMSIRRDDPIGSKLAYLVEHRIAAYALANSIAAAPGGFDDKLAEALGLAATSVLSPTRYELQYKMAVFVPRKNVDAVLAAAAEAGAGRIGNYSHCSFQTPGTGTFLPMDGARPAIGSVGKLERVEEIRLEMVVPQRELQGVIAAVLEAHPYEEVAYDVTPIRNPGVFYGRGRIGELPLKVSPETVLAQVQDALGITSLRCSHRSEMLVGTLAVASGRADGLVWSASRAGAGAIVMGGATPHDMMLAEGSATVIVDVGYKASVAPGLRSLCRQLQNTFAGDAEVVYTE